MQPQLLTEENLQILDSLVDGVYIIDKEFRIIYMNDAAANLTKLDRKSIYGSVCLTLCKSDRCQLGCPITEVLRTGKNVLDLETTLKDKDSNLIQVKMNASILKDENSEPVAGIVSFQKIPKNNYNKALKESGHYFGIIGNSPEMLDIYKTIDEVAKSDACILITGATGVGKDLVARAIYFTSMRKTKNFVKVNCAAFQENLLGSELFGHVKGAFTGAYKDRVGRFEYADGGTLFLDEIGEMPINMQSQLLRVIQEGRFERLGDSISKLVDVRIIAATNKNLQNSIEDNSFRSDLYYRLNVIPIHIPSLTERKVDIPLLVQHFISKFSEKYNKSIEKAAPDTLETLVTYDWPGNIRELENAIEYSFVRSKRNDILCICSLPPYIRDAIKCEEKLSTKEKELDEKTQNILALLRQNNWNKTKVAKILGVNRSTIHRRLSMIDSN